MSRGHHVQVYEPKNGWSYTNLMAERGPGALKEFRNVYPGLTVTWYEPEKLNPGAVTEGCDLVLVHEWNEPGLVARLGRYPRALPGPRMGPAGLGMARGGRRPGFPPAGPGGTGSRRGLGGEQGRRGAQRRNHGVFRRSGGEASPERIGVRGQVPRKASSGMSTPPPPWSG